MFYDKESIIVEVGKFVEFCFFNIDVMLYNFVIMLFGAMEEIGLLVEVIVCDLDVMVWYYIFKLDKIFVVSWLLQFGESYVFIFIVFEKFGVYLYVCTYFGYWW